MATGSDTPAEARSGVTFDVTLEVPWNAPEAYVQLHSDGMFDLEKTVSDISVAGGRMRLWSVFCRAVMLVVCAKGIP